MKNNYKAKQLLKELKERKVSIEELKEFVQLDITFIKEFATVIKNEIETNGKCNERTIEFFDKQVGLLISIIKDGNITKEEKDEIYIIIENINDKIIEIEKNRENNSNCFKKFVMGCLTMLGLAIVFVLGGNNSRNIKS